MDKETSLKITAHIGRVIAEYAPKIRWTQKELEEKRATYSDKKMEQLAAEGYYHGDFQLFYVMLRFCDGMDLWSRADERYLKKLFSQAKRFDKKEFQKDPYLRDITIKERRLGDFLLTESFYERGEFFQYDMPDLSEEIVVPKIGFFTEKVFFPAVYEGNIPWVSVCPSEIHSMSCDTDDARGKVLVLGLGLGYYPYIISQKDEVEEITVIEKSPGIIQLFREEILPQFSRKEKIKLVEADAIDYLKQTKNGDYDFCYADIWEGWQDGAEAYEKILPQEKRLKKTEFRYWIKNEILWYLENVKK
ncbi:MAG: hypothetical protein IKT50_03805 [Clostridia bacterium]|nr:hypothetical protein [Clostridia bacterium]